MSNPRSLPHYGLAPITGSFGSVCEDLHFQSGGTASEALFALLLSVYVCFWRQVFFSSLVKFACYSNPVRPIPEMLCGFI
jgi:hypothetical protein